MYMVKGERMERMERIILLGSYMFMVKGDMMKRMGSYYVYGKGWVMERLIILGSYMHVPYIYI